MSHADHHSNSFHFLPALWFYLVEVFRKISQIVRVTFGRCELVSTIEDREVVPYSPPSLHHLWRI